MVRILGSTGTRRRRRYQLGAVLSLVALLAVLAVPNALAVHDLGVFQLDKNASTADQSTPPAAEDWDLICKAHPSTCTFAPGYSQPSGTTVAKPSQFVVDPSEASTDDILKGGTKDDNDISSWKWASAKPAPPKNDITHAFAAEYTCGGSEDNSIPGCTGTTGDKLLYFGGDRFSNSGSANLAFWFFQHKITQKLADGTTDAQPGQVCTLGAGCNFGGTHKEGEFPHNPNNVGDILIISAFGPHAQVQVYEWVGVGNAPTPCFTNACSLVPLIPASAGQACEDIVLGGPSDNACATVNDAVTPSPWTLNQKNAPANSFQPTNFFEGGLNLTNLGLANACFSSFLMNTRASAAGDAELHDKILGQFQRCVPNLTTSASNQGTVQPGTAVHDTATVTVTGATNPDDATGTVDFFLCGPDLSAPPDCTTGGTPAGAGIALTDTSSPANTHDGISGADSSDVNGTGHELANGFYCFRAEAHLTNYDNPDPATNTTTECFQVLRLATSIVTDPQSPSGTDNTGPFALADNTSVFDHAVVTGDSADGFPTGNVTFFICNPSQVTGTAGNEVCASGDGTQVGSPVPTTNIALSDPPQTEATSAAVTANQLGVWCFRASYEPTNPVYTGSDGDGHRECFTVRTTSSGTSAQNWLPNDHVVVSTATGTLAGTLSITLHSGSCDGAVVYTEPVPNGGAFTATAAGAVYNTTNGSVPATTFKVNDALQGTYYWSIVFTPDSPFADGFTKCETSTVSINDNP